MIQERNLGSEDDLSSLVKDLDKSKPLFCDTETNNFFSNIRLFQIYQEHWDKAQIFDVTKFNLRDVYNEVKDCLTVWHNYSYDGACFANDLGIKDNPFKNFDDTLLLSRLALFDRLDSYSLDSCLEYVWGYDVYKDFDKSKMQKSFVTTKTRNMATAELTEQQLQYAATDVEKLPKLYNLVKSAADMYVYQLDKSFMDKMFKWQQNGFAVNPERREMFREKTQRELDEILAKLPPGLKINSPKQVRELIGSESTSRLVLKAMADENEYAKLITDARTLTKRLNFLDRYSFERVRGYYSPTAVSGRARCSGSDLTDGTDNLMQIPRELKGLFGYTQDDHRFLVYADFSQLEVRTACAESGDPVIRELLESGADMHKYAATKIYNKPIDEITKFERSIGKFANFSLMYLSGSTNFRRMLISFSTSLSDVPSEEECARIVKVWRSIYPGIKAWHERMLNKFKRGDMTNTTLNGRPFRAKLFTDLCGIQNQGLGAEAAKLSCHYLLKELPDAKLCCFIHDSFTLEAQSLDEAKFLAKVLADSMTLGWFESIKNSKIPELAMPSDADVIKDWGYDPEKNPESLYYRYTSGTYEDYLRIREERKLY